MSECLKPSALESIALCGDADPTSRSHLEVCPDCAEMIRIIRENREFLDRHGSALGRAGRAKPWDPGAAPGYELHEELSRGGQGIVYRATQNATHRQAAVKVLLGGDLATPRQRARFEREVELAAGLRHPNIVSVFDSGLTDRGARFVAMEFVEGRPIDEHCARLGGDGSRGSVAWMNEVARLFVQIAEGAGHAHLRGVVHRDLKPSNILVDADGVPRLLDFGLARSALEDAQRPDSLTREFAGTPAYAAPELLSGTARDPIPSADVYSLGVTMYRSLSGEHPYPCDGTIGEFIRAFERGEITPLSARLPRIPKDLETIVHHAMAIDPSRRYGDANALRADIERYLSGDPIDARRDSAWYVLSRLAAKNKPLVSAAAVALATVLASVVGLAFLASDLDRARREAVSSLAESTVQRGRLTAALGDIERAERLLWGEALHAGTWPGDTIAPDGSVEAVRARWALAELYSRVPRRFRATLSGSAAAVGIDARGGTWAISRTNGRSEWNADGAEVSLVGGDAGSFHAHALATDPRGEGTISFAVTEACLIRRDFTTGAHIGPVPLESHFADIAVSDDGALVACVSRREAGWIEVFDGATLARLMRIEDDTYSVSFGRMGAEVVLLTGSWAGPNARITARRVSDWAVVRVLALPQSARAWRGPAGVRSPRVSPDGSTLVAGFNNDIHAYDLTTGASTPVATHEGSAPVQSIDFGGGNHTFAVSRRSGEVVIHRTHDLSILATVRGVTLPHALFYDSPRAIVMVGGAGSVSLYDTVDRPWLTRMDSHSRSVASVSRSRMGVIAWGTEEGSLRIARPTGAIPLTVGAHPAPITSVDFSPDGTLLATGGMDGSVRVWTGEGAAVRTLGEGLGRVWRVRFSPDGERLAASADAGVVTVWRLETGELLRTFRVDADRSPTVDFSPDGATIAVSAVGQGSGVVVFDVESGAVRHRLPGHGTTTRVAIFAPDGRTLATAGDDRIVRIWNAQTGALVRAVRGLPWGPFDLTHHPAGRVMLAVGPGGELVVIDALAGAEVATLRLHERPTFSVVVSHDGRTVLTCGQDPFVGVIDLATLFGYVENNERFWLREISSATP